MNLKTITLEEALKLFLEKSYRFVINDGLVKGVEEDKEDFI